MDPETSKATRTTSVEAKTVIIHWIPQDIINEITDYLATDPDFGSLKSCALVSKSWVPSCQRHLFRVVTFTWMSVERWFETFPTPEKSPAHHVRDLRAWIGGQNCIPEGFFEYTPWFTNTESMMLMGYGGVPPMRTPSLWRLPRSVTTLIINTNVVTLVDIRNLLAQLPNLDDLLLSGSPTPVDRRRLRDIGTGLRGRFSGRLLLCGGYVDKHVVNMLLGIPTRLHFAEIRVQSMHERLYSTVRLAEACGRTLVRLSYTVDLHDGIETFERSFDFSKFPNIQEVDFGIGWMGGGLLWIPTALSTLRRTTSPHLSVFQLSCRPSVSRSIETLIDAASDHLGWIVDEVCRIEREFEGAVTALRDSRFREVLDRLNIN